MREILFRGKCEDGTEWMEGFYAKIENTTCILLPKGTERFEGIEDSTFYFLNPGCYVRVSSSTIGQFTGLHDKNGVRIFEGDVLRTSGEDFITADVGFDEGGYCAGGLFLQSYLWDSVNGNTRIEAKIIGNIHDHPELLQGGEKQ